MGPSSGMAPTPAWNHGSMAAPGAHTPSGSTVCGAGLQQGSGQEGKQNKSWEAGLGGSADEGSDKA